MVAQVFSYMEAEMGYTNVRKYYNFMRPLCSINFIEIRWTFQHKICLFILYLFGGYLLMLNCYLLFVNVKL